jgi:sugar phosphate isomerase/epimerase
MPLSISNIAWSAGQDGEMYSFLRDNGFAGLEIAPTRIFPEKPYERLTDAKLFAERLYAEYGLRISSMQSIWRGRTENIFRSGDERAALAEYTKRAVDFASAINCGNLTFGCPRNRNIPDGAAGAGEIAAEFFARIAGYAAANGAAIALEPNPPFYGVNFINTTAQAFEFVRRIGNGGLKVNADLGALIACDEPLSLIAGNIGLVNHIHISEPKLAPIKKRRLHKKILSLPFGKYFSIEMENRGDLETVKNAVAYISAIARERRNGP